VTERRTTRQLTGGLYDGPTSLGRARSRVRHNRSTGTVPRVALAPVAVRAVVLVDLLT